MKSATKREPGILVDVRRRADLHDLAVVHDADAGRERHRLLLVVGHDHEGDAELVLDVQQLELRVLAQLLVERGERLVEQQELRALDERARERDALALAAGELVRHALAERLHAHELQDVRDPVVDSRPPTTLSCRRPNATFFCTLMCGKSA